MLARRANTNMQDHHQNSYYRHNSEAFVRPGPFEDEILLNTVHYVHD